MSMKIYDHMIMDHQSISVEILPAFKQYLEKEFDLEDIRLHASNVYLFKIPVSGEFTDLSFNQKKFIFEQEVALYEEQYDFDFPFDNTLFERFFKIAWHGVVYHGEIKSL
jgi:hypothetical protein